MEVHQASIYNKQSIEIKYWCLFLSTWSHNAIDQCVAREYSLHHSPRISGRRGGGVGLLVSNAIKMTFKRIHVSPLIT